MNITLRTVRLFRIGALSAVVAGAAMTTTATAQEIPDTGGRVFGLVGGSFADGGSALLTSAGAGVRVTRTLGLDFEVFHVSGLESSDDDFFIQELSFAPPFDIERDGSLTAFLSKIVVDFPVGNRLIPFVSGGGGVGRVSRELSFDFGGNLDGARDLPPRFFREIGRDRRPSIFPREFERSETGLALTLGGGLDIRLWKGMTVGAEARWLRVLAGTSTLDLAQVASRVAYRF